MINEETVNLINDLKFKLKSRDANDEIANALNNSLDNIINIFVLDQDPHAFASIPTGLPPPISLNSDRRLLSTKWYKNLKEQILQFIPYTQIEFDKIVNRLVHFAPKVYLSDIKLSLLSLIESGEIEMDSCNIIKRIK